MYAWNINGRNGLWDKSLHAIPGAMMITNQKCPVVISFPERRGERQKRLFFMKP